MQGVIMFGHQDENDDLKNLRDTITHVDDSKDPIDSSVINEISSSNGVSAGGPITDSSQSSIDIENKDDLLQIKQQALTKLSPLVTQLNQTPLEKFQTLMMMIQASDDQSLIKSAYQAALEIGDEKQKAQALLDVVNEINYFTHPNSEYKLKSPDSNQAL